MAEETITKGFETRSRRIAEHFIQNVVIFDDLAEFGSGAGERVGTLNVPTLQDTASMGPDNDPPGGSSVSELHAGGVPLDAKAVIDRFAELGSVCAVLKPAQGENFLPKVTRAASRADIIVLDWKIGDSYGEETLNIIRQILQADSNSERLRLLAVYTGEPKLEDIATQVKAVIDEFYEGLELRTSGEFCISKGPVRAVILAKEGTVDSTQEGVIDQMVPESGLADRLVDEFSIMSKGLLRNVTLEGLAALRDQVYRLLSKFDTTLDPAYLGHRLLLPHPRDAEDHIVEALGAELLSLLEDAKPGKQADLQAVREWLTEAIDQGIDLDDPMPFTNGTGTTLEGWLALLDKGIQDANVRRGIRKNRLEKQSTQAFTRDESDSLESNRRLAALFSLKTRYSSDNPRLTLGTILCRKLATGRSYFLCLQPKCDSVRLGVETGFPLLPLSVRSQHQEFDLVVNVGVNQWKHFQITPTPKALTVHFFMPGPNPPGEVVASSRLGRLYFKDTGGAVYWWIAEMKDEHALKVAGEMASALARPGPNNAEWLRLASKP